MNSLTSAGATLDKEMNPPCRLCGDEHEMLTLRVVDGVERKVYNCPVTPHESRLKIMRESPAREYEVCSRKFAEACQFHTGEVERKLVLFMKHGIGRKWSSIAVDRFQQEVLDICDGASSKLGKEVEKKPRSTRVYNAYERQKAETNKRNQDERDYMIGKLLRKPCGICGSGDHQAINQGVTGDQSTISYECPAALKEQWDPDLHPSMFRSNIEICPYKYVQMYNFDQTAIEESFSLLKEFGCGKGQSKVSWYVMKRNMLKICDDQKEAGRWFKSEVRGEELDEEDDSEDPPIPLKLPRSL